MGWTKRQFIEQAFDEIGLASYAFDLTPEQMQSALRRLDTMIAAWNALGIRLGYPLPSSPQDSDLDEQTNVPDRSNEAIYTNLAIKLAPSYGKQVMPDTKARPKNRTTRFYPSRPCQTSNKCPAQCQAVQETSRGASTIIHSYASQSIQSLPVETALSNSIKEQPCQPLINSQASAKYLVAICFRCMSPITETLGRFRLRNC